MIIVVPVDQRAISDSKRVGMLRVQRNTSLQLLTNDVISEETYQRLTTQIDAALAKEQIAWQKVSDVESEFNATI